MKIAHMADFHLRGKDLAVAMEQIEAALDACYERFVHHLVICGDIFHNPQIGDRFASTGEIASRIMKVLGECSAELLAAIHILPGNHDVSGARSAPATAIFAGVGGHECNTNIVQSPRIGEIGNDAVGVFIPWIYGSDTSAHSVAERLVNDARLVAGNRRVILYGHMDIIGAVRQGNNVSDHAAWGMSRAQLAGLDVDHIAIGHYHKRQELVPGRGGYIGAIRQIHHGESAHPQGFEVFDTKTGEVEWVDVGVQSAHWTATYREEQGCPLTPDMVDERSRIIFDGWRPAAEIIAGLEAKGAQVEIILDRAERVGRLAEHDAEEHQLGNPRHLLRMWCEKQTPAVDNEPLEGAMEEIE